MAHSMIRQFVLNTILAATISVSTLASVPTEKFYFQNAEDRCGIVVTRMGGSEQYIKVIDNEDLKRAQAARKKGPFYGVIAIDKDRIIADIDPKFRNSHKSMYYNPYNIKFNPKTSNKNIEIRLTENERIDGSYRFDYRRFIRWNTRNGRFVSNPDYKYFMKCDDMEEVDQREFLWRFE